MKRLVDFYLIDLPTINIIKNIPEQMLISYLHLKDKEYGLLSVYDYSFKNDIKVNLNSIIKNELLFGEVLSMPILTKGKFKGVKLGCLEVDRKTNELPFMKYSPILDELKFEKPRSDYNWFYLPKGKYNIFDSIKSSYTIVSHLEHNEIYTLTTIKLRIIYELIRKSDENLSIEFYNKILLETIINDENFSKVSKDELSYFCHGFLMSIMDIPIYNKIPFELRGELNK
jgi:hypothetical protein